MSSKIPLAKVSFTAPLLNASFKYWNGILSVSPSVTSKFKGCSPSLDGDTFDQDKFNSEMDKAGFRGGVNNDALFYYWDGRKGSFESVMSEAERVIKQAQAKLTSDGLPISNGRYKALQNALKIHLNARRLDQATKLLKTFETWALEKGYKVVLGDEISRPPVPPYKQIDAEAIVKGKGLEGAEADELRNWLKEQNAAGESKRHVDAILTATELGHKLAAACAKK
ncbi:hypothetical protein BKA61DRAFT_697104 [Leptodontidium sp. MPI-SDFR-AT-0119]|nr:hypothetical protein BKA61DRAFT_697104 [Leptodontidium sp. MPI-SDFR-AT-0119]